MAQTTNTEEQKCLDCEAIITPADIRANDPKYADDGYVCVKCMDKAAGFATEFFGRNLDEHQVEVYSSCNCDHCEHCEQHGGTTDGAH